MPRRRPADFPPPESRGSERKPLVPIPLSPSPVHLHPKHEGTREGPTALLEEEASAEDCAEEEAALASESSPEAERTPASPCEARPAAGPRRSFSFSRRNINRFRTALGCLPRRSAVQSRTRSTQDKKRSARAPPPLLTQRKEGFGFKASKKRLRLGLCCSC